MVDGPVQSVLNPGWNPGAYTSIEMTLGLQESVLNCKSRQELMPPPRNYTANTYLVRQWTVSANLRILCKMQRPQPHKDRKKIETKLVLWCRHQRQPPEHSLASWKMRVGYVATFLWRADDIATAVVKNNYQSIHLPEICRELFKGQKPTRKAGSCHLVCSIRHRNHFSAAKHRLPETNSQYHRLETNQINCTERKSDKGRNLFSTMSKYRL